MTALKLFKLLLCCKKPEVINLSYLHVFIKDKPALFIVWEIKNVWAVQLKPLNRSYYTEVKALVTSIPKEQKQVTLAASNFWRKTNVPLTLYAVELDELTTAELIHGFRPLNKVSISTPHITAIRNLVSINSFCLKQRSTAIEKIASFNITIQPFNYP